MTCWDDARGITERYLRIADDIATLTESEDEGRIDETVLTPSFKRKSERYLKCLKKLRNALSSCRQKVAHFQSVK